MTAKIMTIEEVKSEFDRLVKEFNNPNRKTGMYELAKRISGLQTRYYNFTGDLLHKPPRKKAGSLVGR